MMNKVERVKKIIKDNYENAQCGCFFTPNWVGDPMVTVYEDEEVTVDICYPYMYFEVFGLNDEEIREVLAYYDYECSSNKEV